MPETPHSLNPNGSSSSANGSVNMAANPGSTSHPSAAPLPPAAPQASAEPSVSAAEAPNSAPEPNGAGELVRVQIPADDLTYEAIKTAIYSQARYLYERSRPIRKLLLSSDIYEILSRRLVFKTAAHKDLPHFITPYGNLRVQMMDASLDEPLSFIIEG